MRKVKFTQDSFDEKLGGILEEFPIIDVSAPYLFEDAAVLKQRIARTCTRSCPPS